MAIFFWGNCNFSAVAELTRTSLRIYRTLNLPVSLWGGLKKPHVIPKTKSNLANFHVK